MLTHSASISGYSKTEFRLGVDAMTLLIFLSRTTWARFIASDLRLVTHDSFCFRRFLACRSSALIRPSERQRRWAAGPPSNLECFRWFLGNNLQVEQRPDCCGVNSIEHLLEQIKTLLLVFD